jgi:dTDP-4-amino-4,6-dideoxygalactose transaminase
LLTKQEAHFPTFQDRFLFGTFLTSVATWHRYGERDFLLPEIRLWSIVSTVFAGPLDRCVMVKTVEPDLKGSVLSQPRVLVSEDVQGAKSSSPVTKVPLLDLRSQYQSVRDEVRTAMDRVLESQQFILGPEVEALEEEIAQYCGCKYAIGVSSGTDALLVSLMALGVTSGDEVLTTPFTFFATVGSVLRLGASVAFADISSESFNIDPAELEKNLRAGTKAIMPVHLFGQSADMEPILHVAEKHGVPVIEDAAQAIGSEYHGHRVGSMGAVGCFSFFPSKNLGAFGDGGMVTTNDSHLARRIKMLRNHGSATKYDHEILGGNFRLDALQAAVLRVKLKHLDSWSAKRGKNAAFYTRRFRELGLAGKQIIPPVVVHERHIYNQYVIRAEERDRLREFLGSKGVATEIYYPKALHLQSCMPEGRYREGDFPVTEAACASVMALPIFPELTVDQKEYVVSTIAEFYRG